MGRMHVREQWVPGSPFLPALIRACMGTRLVLYTIPSSVCYKSVTNSQCLFLDVGKSTTVQVGISYFCAICCTNIPTSCTRHSFVASPIHSFSIEFEKLGIGLLHHHFDRLLARAYRPQRGRGHATAIVSCVSNKIQTRQWFITIVARAYRLLKEKRACN